jgi:hypothetical protein
MCISYEKYRKKIHRRMLGFSDNLTLKKVSKNFFITSYFDSEQNSFSSYALKCPSVSGMKAKALDF